ncbi:MAG TPA: sporulation protein [Candidatus Limnocylindrales bacterium]|nr:sporulation protein [Candidatus Limnocylindrales bacterium]
MTTPDGTAINASWRHSSQGVEWQLTLERDRLIPGRLTSGTVTITSGGDVDARALVVALIAVEHWQHEEHSTDAQGNTTTRTVTTKQELRREPVQLSGPVQLGRGDTRTFPFEMPVPPLGPASLEAKVAGMTWVLEAKLDRPGWPDSSIEAPVTVVQPVALLRAGVVDVGEFALYPEADAGAGDLSAAITLDPLPLCSGSPFHGSVILRTAELRKLQEIRAEIRVHVEATVSSGKNETITAWAATVVPALEVQGERVIDFQGSLPATPLPTIELPHGRASAAFHLILATAWARDPHLVRDVTIATTLEL